jgi:hypothetical protein
LRLLRVNNGEHAGEDQRNPSGRTIDNHCHLLTAI